MVFLMTTLVCAFASWALAPFIHKYPWVLYVVVLVIDALFFLTSFSFIAGPIGRLCTMLIRRGTLAFALFTVVMYIGVLPHNSALRRRMNSVRAPLSIAASLLIAAHMAVNAANFLPRLVNPSLKVSITGALIIAIVLFVLVVALGLTSFTFVKERMDAKHWKTLQRFAYLFYGLVFVHILLLLGPGALAKSGATRINLACYAAVVLGYAVLRFVRSRLDAAEAKKLKQQSTLSHG